MNVSSLRVVSQSSNALITEIINFESLKHSGKTVMELRAKGWLSWKFVIVIDMEVKELSIDHHW